LTISASVCSKGSACTGSGSGGRGRFFFSKNPAGNLVEIAAGDLLSVARLTVSWTA
jgi:hypothetical protein